VSLGHFLFNIIPKHDTVSFNKQTVHQTGLYQSRNGFWVLRGKTMFLFRLHPRNSLVENYKFQLTGISKLWPQNSTLTVHLIQLKNLKYFHLALSKKLHPDIAHKIPEYENGCCSTHKNDLCSLKP
jgi:hypothetical protein